MTPLVLLPGFMCDARLFAPQVAVMSRTRDVRTPVPIGSSMAAMAASVLADAPDRFALAGLSMGGILALEVLAQAPDRVARLAILDGTHRADAPANYDVRTRQIADVKAGRLDAVMRDELKPAYLAEGSDRVALLDLCLDMARGLGPEVFEAQALALRDRRGYEEVLARAQVPVLLLVGREDRLCPVARHEEMAALVPHARLVIVEGAGHLSTLEQPQAVTAALQIWLEEEGP